MSMVHTGILRHYYVQIQYEVHADTDRTKSIGYQQECIPENFRRYIYRP